MDGGSTREYHAPATIFSSSYHIQYLLPFLRVATNRPRSGPRLKHRSGPARRFRRRRCSNLERYMLQVCATGCRNSGGDRRQARGRTPRGAPHGGSAACWRNISGTRGILLATRPFCGHFVGTCDIALRCSPRGVGSRSVLGSIPFSRHLE
jgi:hypothetical protein